MSLTQLARPEVLDLVAYQPANYEAGLVRLNANEAPWRSSQDHCDRPLNYYPPARPGALAKQLAELYGVSGDEVFVTRGTSEAIDLMIRCFCRPGVDHVVICPPTFGMYEVYAGIQGARISRIPLQGDALRLPVDSIVQRWDDTTRLVFVTTPNNPTGHSLDVKDIERLAIELSGTGIVVIDAAYVEFANPEALMHLLRHDNVVVLRTLSKAFGLAGVRCGALIGNPTLLNLVEKVMPPYALPTPTIEQSIAALLSDGFARMPQRIATLIGERERMRQSLANLACVARVYPSDANFLLVQCHQPHTVLTAARDAGILLRDFSNNPLTPNAVRITIGGAQTNDSLLAAMAGIEEQALP
ncbi:MAG: histidinol-phosphate transaminase [Pseudomonadota bacterium]